MCSVYSALSGEAPAVVDDYEGKTAKEVKRSLAAQIGISRFRQRFWSEDWSEIQGAVVLASEPMKIQLVVLDFLPPELEDHKLINASGRNDWKALENLLQCPRSPNSTDALGSRPLQYASENGHVECMRLLLEAGAEKDARDTTTQGWTALLLAAYGGHAVTVCLLLEAGADPDLATLIWWTPLNLAA